jgi:outer membrane protein TolC
MSIALSGVLYAKHIDINDIDKDKLVIQYASFNTLKPTLEATKAIQKYDYYIEKNSAYGIYVVNIDKKDIKSVLKEVKKSSSGAFVKDKKLDICNRANSINIDENKILSKNDKQKLISPYLYSCIDQDMIKKLTIDISKEYAKEGYHYKKAKAQEGTHKIDVSIINEKVKDLDSSIKEVQSSKKAPTGVAKLLREPTKVKSLTGEIELSNLVKSVINQNINLIFERINLDISKTYVSEAYGAFESEFYLNTGIDSVHTKNNVKDALVRNDTDTYKEKSTSSSMGLRGTNTYGTQWNISLKTQKTDSSLIEADETKEPEYESGLYLEIKQPLLKNFGKDVGQTNINIAKLKSDEAKEGYKKQVIELIGKTIATYWRLYSAIEIQKSWSENIKLAEKQEKNIKLMVDAGNISKVALYEIQNSIRNSKIEMLSTQDVVNKERSNLLSLLNISLLNNKQNFIPSDKPTIENIKVPKLDDALTLATNNWFDLNIVKEKIKQERLKYKYLQNQLQPSLDLIARADSTALENNLKKSMKEIGDSEFNSWYLGLNFAIPLGENTQAKSKLTRSKLELSKLLLEEKRLNTNLENSLYTKIENLKLNKNKMKELQKSVDFRNSMIDIYNEELKFGKINIEDLTNGYKKRVLAKREWLKGLMDIKLSQTVLEIAVGALLDKYQINIKE